MIVFPQPGMDPAAWGGKAKALAQLMEAELPIPPWFVVLPEALQSSLSHLQQRAFQQAATPAEMEMLLQSVSLAPAVLQGLQQALARLGGGSFAVRSSALDEDGAHQSFAGQLDSFLFVPASQVPDKVLAVWRSGFSQRVWTYRREQGLSLRPTLPAVLVQTMVAADVAGVAFGADPVTGRRGVVLVSGVYGLGTALVSGEADADSWQVDRNNHIVHSQVATKRTAHRPDPNAPEGVRVDPVADEQQNQLCLTPPQVQAVAKLARAAGTFFGRPQDVEWAFAKGQLYLLQSRPVTTLGRLADPDGLPCLWDNSNIAESYRGITTPLTFSFARRAYEHVYRQFCRLMGVPGATLAANDFIFSRMLGLLHGRVYYNLLNWYRLIALLPGYQTNRRFMEQMMGLRDPVPEDLLPAPPQASGWAGVADKWRVACTVAGLVVNYIQLPGRIRRFYARLNKALAPQPLTLWRTDELVAYYNHLEAQLLTRWDAPVVNDFLAMVFYGLLRNLCARWVVADDVASTTLQNNLLCGEGGMISAEPAQRVRAMALQALHHPHLVNLLCQADWPTLRAALRQQAPPLWQAFEAYRAKFGDRCLEELKLESHTLDDDPLPLLRSVGQLARRFQAHAPQEGLEAQLRAQAEEQVRQALARHPLRRLVFGWVLQNARHRVRDRENLRFERTRVFGQVRRIMLEIGKRLAADGLLNDPRDVLYLEVGEVTGFVDGTTTTPHLAALVSVRHDQFARYALLPEPASRFETRGAVHQGNSFQAPPSSAGGSDWSGEQRRGTGCCPGRVTGRVRVITDPHNALLEAGDILVAERTDPGWIMLFPAAAAVVVEFGSLLSHSAIVAREMGIPGVVAVAGVTRWLQTGDWVTVDGQTGLVRKLSSQEVLERTQARDGVTASP